MTYSAIACTQCHYSSRNLGGPGEKELCWRVGTNPVPGDDELPADEARAPGMPCGPEGTFFEDHDKVIASWREGDRRSDDYTYWDR